MAAKRIFISYSSPDVDKANLIREAIEAAGVTCWIAPRDLEAGNQWGGSIVQAIQACEAVVVVFSEAANRSPQVAREMELSVANRKPLVPIRVANDMPTDDMQYFLGVSHWFNAFAKPLDTYLPDIVASVKSILAKENNPWANAMRRMPKSRNGQMLLVIGSVVLAVILLATFLKPPSLASLAKMEENPLAGRWEAKIKDVTGKASDCVLDLPKGSVMATFSDTCPEWLAGSSGMLSAQKGMGVMAPDVYKSSDTGSFSYNNQAGGMFAGAFKFGLFGGMTTRDNHFGDIKWKKISDSKPLAKATAGIVPDTAQWPLSNVSGMIAKANTFMRSKWAADAVLMEVDVKPGSSGSADPTLTYYSPSTRHVRSLSPASTTGAMGEQQLRGEDTRQSIPDHVLDLPAALSQAGLQASDVEEADLEWTNGGCGTGNFAIDNAIMPRCPPGNFEGVQWRLMVKNNNPRYVPAVQ
jgi:hypothetical protein